MALPAELGEQNLKVCPKNQKLSVLSAFQLLDPVEITLRQSEYDTYRRYQQGIPWDLPQRFLKHPYADKFRYHADKKAHPQQMEMAGHAIIDWQFNRESRGIMRVASYAVGHHPGYGVLISNGLSEQQDGRYVGKETVMERTVYFEHPDGFTIVDDRFITRYPKEIADLLTVYRYGYYQKNKDAVVWASDSAKANGYEFEFYYGQPRVVLPGTAKEYLKYGTKSYFED